MNSLTDDILMHYGMPEGLVVILGVRVRTLISTAVIFLVWKNVF